MTFKERLPYFLVGLTIGIIIAAFIFNKKNTTFDYGPNSRVLKNIRTKERIYTQKAISALLLYKLDTAVVSTILKKGDVDLGNKIKLDSCLYQYTIKGKKEFNNVSIIVKNCETAALISDVIVE